MNLNKGDIGLNRFYSHVSTRFEMKAVLASRSRVFQKMLYQAPSPQRKKEPPPRENKLRLFLKRSSEPLLNLQNSAQQVNCLAFHSKHLPPFKIILLIVVNPSLHSVWERERTAVDISVNASISRYSEVSQASQQMRVINDVSPNIRTIQCQYLFCTKHIQFFHDAEPQFSYCTIVRRNHIFISRVGKIEENLFCGAASITVHYSNSSHSSVVKPLFFTWNFPFRDSLRMSESPFCGLNFWNV